jgi:transposase
VISLVVPATRLRQDFAVNAKRPPPTTPPINSPIAGGRGRLRRSLFAAALPAAFRWNKALMALYARLIANGKAHNAALVACARKLLIYANTVVQRGTP